MEVYDATDESGYTDGYTARPKSRIPINELPEPLKEAMGNFVRKAGSALFGKRNPDTGKRTVMHNPDDVALTAGVPVDVAIMYEADDGEFKLRAGNPNFYNLLTELADLHHTKNQDYCGEGQYQGMDNFVEAARQAGVSVRQIFHSLQGVKIARLKVLRRKDREPNHESIADTMKDLCNYLLLEMAFERTYDWIDDPKAGVK